MNSAKRIIDYYTHEPITEFYVGKSLQDRDGSILLVTNEDVEQLMSLSMLEVLERYYCSECAEEVYPHESIYFCECCETYICREGIEKIVTYKVKKSVISKKEFDNKKFEKSLTNPDIAGGVLTVLKLNNKPGQNDVVDAIQMIFEGIDDLHIINDSNCVALGYGEQIINIKSDGNLIEIRGKNSYLYSLAIREIAYLFDCESTKKKLMLSYLPGYDSSKLETELYEYIPKLDRLVEKQRLGIRNNLHTAIYMLKCNIDLPDRTFLIFNALRGLESIIKLIAAKYEINYIDKLTMFNVDNGHVKLSKECEEKLGSSVKTGLYKRMYTAYRKERNVYFHWDKLLTNPIDGTKVIKDDLKAPKIITKILELINEACEVM
ncbi:type II toxin-antitoxin system RnlA family toxin [Proteiniclasticum ruminis]|uniref:RNase LS, toxin n=1 Tax=Proteiniclasticum ruminis TaxID=398199 RepID=A0A1I4ZNX1_9CLOT|nr:type II toxin-antitoxin system RnlA family toxin [Proteiniclasticum ruminis]SFN51679.1 RNase LS, toxin [Proteiniclasticum ruminis]